MQGSFGTVVWIVAAVGVVGGLVGLLMNRRTWDDYHASHMLLETDPTPKRSSTVERDIEIRELLEARNARRRRRGEPEIDVEQEFARLTAPQVDAELREEIRQLVVARNHRRARQGKPPLDVESEIEREIAGIANL